MNWSKVLKNSSYEELLILWAVIIEMKNSANFGDELKTKEIREMFFCLKERVRMFGSNEIKLRKAFKKQL